MASLGIDGFSFDDLYRPAGLERLYGRFLLELRALSPDVAAQYERYRVAMLAGTARGGLTGPQESDLLIAVAGFTSTFLTRLFRIDRERDQLGATLKQELGLFDFKREFVTRKVFKKGATDRPTRDELPALDARMALLLRLGFGADLPPLDGGHLHRGPDHERALADAIIVLMNVERHFGGHVHSEPVAAAWTRLREALLSTTDGKAAFGSTLVGDDLSQVRGLLSLADRWTFARASFTPTFHGWSTITQPKPLVFDKLVELHVPDASRPEVLEGPPQHLRRRDGFTLTDPRFGTRAVMSEVDYCVICHEREKDSCSKGIKERDPIAAGGTYKKNALGIPLAGCPLEEHISELHVLKGRGDSLGALAMVMLDNPMCPGTGHRICNDCMKACIFQKQEPVNIPQIETSALTDVLALPWGFELYGLLTRFNPLNVKRPFAAPANGKNVMVVGLGPAGYTLAHYLLNEGFTVAGIDGLKIEPFPDELTGRNGKPLTPIRDWKTIASSLDTRVLEGFGGVSEYGITVRWDKSFLTLIHLTLARDGFRAYGGVRFGGTLTVDDAWRLGVDHLALAAGAGKPTLVPMKNNLLRGVRAASDFLMGLQLTGAFKRDSLTNLQVRLPALVIGGGLTAIDTATELLAYYPVQVEKVLARHETLTAAIGEAAVFARLNAEELVIYREFLEHGRAVKAERARAASAGEAPDFVRLVRGWGGVSLCYRRGLTDAPAYRLNHEEVVKALEEGIRFIERVSPTEAHADEHGAVKSLTFERMALVDGKLKGTGTFYELPARTVCVAAGTHPNVTSERERPGTFKLDADDAYFRGYLLDMAGDGTRTLREVEAHEDLGREVGFFTSYEQSGRYVSFYGDNHPTYAGNVVKAMASAKDGYPHVVRLFERELSALTPAEQPARDAARAAFFERLDASFLASVVAVNRLTPTIVEVVLKAPFAAKHFSPGQFFRLQNFERTAPVVDGTKLMMEGLALTGAWVDQERGLLSTIVLELGASTRMCAMLKPGERVILMGPTGAPTEIPRRKETVLLAGGGLGNAVLFSIGHALRAAGCRVLYFAGYRKHDDVYKVDELEASADQVVWAVDSAPALTPRRSQDRAFVGNIVQAMVAYAEGKLDAREFDFKEIDRIIAIGSDRMMKAVKDARHGALKPFLKPEHCAIGSINSPMQCMMKEICAQCLQRHVDPRTGKESFVFSCFNQDQALDLVDFAHLDTRLRANSVLEKQTDLFFQHLVKQHPDLLRT